ncbi:MAG: hypothetical protein H6654_11430 [Ardenticatenaceae bacterium]|nr:hypothetical protein [Anaerolineales bacterium]MCB8937591.1 hypothetical protein [Ardenticatenaceae bacterium]MCB8974160.1 hypothetical protein [Ardenticatenaceae bacterium]
MTKRKHKREKAQLFHHLTQQAKANSQSEHDAPLTAAAAATIPLLASLPESRELTKMKKFRFQLLHEWIVSHLPQGRVADVGGGKGLLAYLLQQSGWQATVIDPVAQTLPDKYKDLTLNRRVKIDATETVPHITRPFAPELAEQFDLLVSMHAHGCNVQLIDVAATSGKPIILLPCCIIDEPLLPAPGQHWIACLMEYAQERNLLVRPFRLNFRGQNIGLFISIDGHI